MSMIVRPGRVEDAAAITAIYNYALEERTATFETTPRRVEDIAAWFAADYPVAVVDEIKGSLRGFAAAFPYRSRACYAGVREFSVYVAHDARGQGIGRLALEHLFALAREDGAWKLLSRIFPENLASRKLCAALGFREVGIYQRHAQLDGVWRDVVIVEKLLDTEPSA